MRHKMVSPPHTRRRVVEAPARKPAVELREVHVFLEPETDPDASYLDQDEFADRRAEYERGEFGFLSIRAKAEVVIEGVEQELTSGGLSGIESDSEDEYLEEIIAAEWSSLRGILKTVGVPTSQLPLQVKREWVHWRT